MDAKRPIVSPRQLTGDVDAKRPRQLTGDVDAKRRPRPRQLTGDVHVSRIIARLRELGSPEAVKAMQRFGISGTNTLGVSVPALRRLAREIGRDHEMAAKLWSTGIHEARTLAALIDDPAQVTEAQMDAWVLAFDSWDVCDACCGNLFDRTPYAFAKAIAWSRRDEELVKRAGFTLMATLAVHDKSAADSRFERFLPRIRAEATDPRNFVKKAVNWALRQIGKRNAALHARAIAEARIIAAMDAPSARWIANDALRELATDAVRARIASKRVEKEHEGAKRRRARRD